VATALDRAPDSMLITICQGALAAASAGLFNGYRCTTHHELIDQLQLVAPQANVVADRVFVIDGHWQRARVQPASAALPGADVDHRARPVEPQHLECSVVGRRGVSLTITRPTMRPSNPLGWPA
jgi:hypothetical protein